MKTKTRKGGKISASSIYACTHTGLVRVCNEDSYVYFADGASLNSFAAVADGIGGHESGDIASKLCMRSLITLWRNMGIANEKSHDELLKFLDYAVKESNDIIYRINQSFNIQQPMGTTLVGAIFTPDKIIIVHAGDSRCYRLKNGSVEQLTRDHSFVEELIVRNIIKREDAKIHPFSHIISKCVGTSPELVPEFNVFERNGTDRFIFCTDGLVNHLDDNNIRDIVAKAPTLQDTVRNLLYASLKRGGEDNITILAVFPESPEFSDKTEIMR